MLESWPSDKPINADKLSSFSTWGAAGTVNVIVFEATASLTCTLAVNVTNVSLSSCLIVTVYVPSFSVMTAASLSETSLTV